MKIATKKRYICSRFLLLGVVACLARNAQIPVRGLASKEPLFSSISLLFLRYMWLFNIYVCLKNLSIYHDIIYKTYIYISLCYKRVCVTCLCGVRTLENSVNIWKNPLCCITQTGTQTFVKDSRRCEGKLSENVYVNVQSRGSLNLAQYN